MRSLVLFTLLFAACAPRDVADMGSGDAMAPGPPFLESCTSLCVRFSDCSLAYPDDDLCPPGFACSLKHPGCSVDGGARD
jgi:hypothetical protein